MKINPVIERILRNGKIYRTLTWYFYVRIVKEGIKRKDAETWFGYMISRLMEHNEI